MTIYLCNPDFEGILCGIYDAWMGLKGHDNVRLELKGTYQEMELFSEYVDVGTSPEKVGKVTRSVCKKLSQSVYDEAVHHKKPCSPPREIPPDGEGPSHTWDPETR